jgi:glutaredoxin
MKGVPTKTVTFYTKSGCHLCEEAYEQLETLRDALGFTIDTVDIRSTDELYAEYRATIPAVRIGARVFIEGPFDQDVLEEIRKEVSEDNANSQQRDSTNTEAS